VGWLALCAGQAAAQAWEPPGVTDGSLSDPPILAPSPDLFHPAAAPRLAPGPSEEVVWTEPELDRPGKVRSQTEGPFGSLTASSVLRHPVLLRNDPLAGQEWSTDESWRLDVGPVFVFGQVGAGCDPVLAREMTVSGKTGVAWKIPVVFGGEVLLRGGRSLNYTDPLRPEAARAGSEVFLEMQARLPLPWNLGLEYDGTAKPALTPLERDRLNQDVRVVVPVGRAGNLRLGARHQWENLTVPRPWTEGVQVYLGLELKH
jgi:hypothetical protein